MLDNYYTFRALDIARERRADADRHRLAVLAAEGRPVQPDPLDRIVDAIAAAIESITGSRSSANEAPRTTSALKDRPTAHQ